jgi:hypothetical protein
VLARHRDIFMPHYKETRFFMQQLHWRSLLGG